MHPRNPSPVPGLASLTVCLCLAVAGCDSGDKKTASSEKSKGPSPAKTSQAGTAAPQDSRDAEIPLAPIGLVDQVLHKEPEKGEWQGELFNDLASAQLKALGKLLEPVPGAANGVNGVSEASLASIVTEDIQADDLSPVGKDAVFESVEYTVERAASSRPKIQGRAAFAEELNAMALRAEFKIFGVKLDDASGEPVSTVRVQLTGIAIKQGLASLTSTWTCRWKWSSPDAPPLLKSVKITGIEKTTGRMTTEGELSFSDATASVFKGVDIFEPQFNRGMDHWAARLERRYGIGLSGWHGLAIGDANGDGLDDLYVCEPGGLPNRLFIRKADGSLIDASSLSGTDFRLQTQSALFVDLDNDGDQDLVLATTLGVIFMANDGRGNFAVKSSKLVPEAAPLALAAADFDLDGDLDLYVGCYSLRGSNVDGVQILGRPIPYHDANNGGRNVLYRNDRNWRFTNATQELSLDANNRRFTLAASWEDYDDDGDPDLYVANDYGRNNLYRNDRDDEGNVKFTDVAKTAGVEDISAGMSVTWGDADGDGDRDIYVSNMWSSAGNRIAYQRNFLADAKSFQREEFQRHARGNSLFLNNGDGSFTDNSVAAGVTMGRWAWGSLFTDINNDGMEDIVIANGFITQPEDSGDL